MTATLIYCYDPMCSWCWGFRPTWNKLEKALQPLVDRQRLTIQPMLGGLAQDSDTLMTDNMKTKLESTWHRIQDTLGTDFNFDYWKVAKPRRSTYPACRACLVARDVGLEKEMSYAIQKAYYLEAKNPSDMDTLISCAKQVGLKEDGFTKSMEHIKREAILEQEITQTRHLGLDSFPSLAVIWGDHLIPIPLDYQNPQTMLSSIKAALPTED